MPLMKHIVKDDFTLLCTKKKVGLQTPIKLPDHIGYGRNIKLR